MKLMAIATLLGVALVGATQVSATEVSSLIDKEVSSLIDKEQAQSIAFNHAGVIAKDVTFVNTTLEYDDMRLEYDVEFILNGIEYDYEIDAITGMVLDYDNEVDDDWHRWLVKIGYFLGEQKVGVGQINSEFEQIVVPTQNNENSRYITKEQAQEIAYNHAGIIPSEVRKFEIEFEYDKGVSVYEMEWEMGYMEYECEVNALTGEIYKFKID
ncbi:MAG: hypothetical protein BEN19_06995 [Epulopiscium sp. Nuni2H_MBin003]|nr:MAG: hypothetical protein BEN19_06995 [Epulopiscium sp. Nuni2H_MBin003]